MGGMEGEMQGGMEGLMEGLMEDFPLHIAGGGEQEKHALLNDEDEILVINEKIN